MSLLCTVLLVCVGFVRYAFPREVSSWSGAWDLSPELTGLVTAAIDFTQLCAAGVINDDWDTMVSGLGAMTLSLRPGVIFTSALIIESDQTGAACGLGVGCVLSFGPLPSGRVQLLSSSSSGMPAVLNAATLCATRPGFIRYPNTNYAHQCRPRNLP